MYINGRNIIFTSREVGSVDAYLNRIHRAKPLSTEEEYNLWLRMQHGNESAREQLIFANLPYVVSVAKKYLPSGAPFEDLIQAGNLGLVKATNVFDASLGFRLITFATWHIENEVRKTANDYNRHNIVSLDKPFNVDDEDGLALIDILPAYHDQATDWDFSYSDALSHLEARAEKRQHGFGTPTDDLHRMLLKGYTTSDFARKHRLNEAQMTRFLTILREEAGHMLRPAA